MTPLRSVLLAFALLAPLAAFAQDASLHDLDTRFTDQRGKAMRFEDLKGGPVLVTMFYGNCEYACPMLVSRMKRLEAKVPEADRAKLRMVLVTFDPKRDSVEALRKMHGLYSLDERWGFLRVDDAEAVKELAALLGVKYRFMPDGAINHSSVITLLDGKGIVRARMDGMDLPDETILDPLVPMLSARTAR